jgi:uncharacterized protein YkwD
MSAIDRDYMTDRGAANRVRRTAATGEWNVLREKRIKRLASFVWSALVIGLLAAAIFIPYPKEAANCNASKLVVDANRDGRFTYTDVGALALQVTALPLKVARLHPQFDPLISFLKIKSSDCTSPKASILSGTLLLSLFVLTAWMVSLSLLLLRYAAKYLLFDLMKISPFGRWNAIIFRYTYPRFVWLVSPFKVSLLCICLTTILLLKNAEATSTDTRKFPPKPPVTRSENDRQKVDNRAIQSKIDENKVAPQMTYEQRVVGALIEARRQGCKGHQGVSQPIQHTEGMDLLARLVLDGVTNYEERIRQAKYLAFGGSGVKLTLKSSPEATGREAASALCSDLLNPSLTVAGVAVSKNSAHVHVAREFRPPKVGEEIATANRFLTRVNQARSTGYKCGDKYYPSTTPLKLEELLTKASRLHAEDVFRNPSIGHRGSDGSSPTERAQRAGYRFPVGENLTNLSDRPEDAAESLLGSPGHCANIMNPDFNEMGLGYFIDATRMPGIVWVQKLSRGS